MQTLIVDLGLLVAVMVFIVLLLRAGRTMTKIAHEIESIHSFGKPQSDPPVIGKINEQPLPTGKAALEFWQGLHRSQSWTVLSHIAQADARNYLRDAKDEAEKGNQTGALFFLGKAHEAAFLAVKPEAQVNRIIRAMEANQRAQQQAEPAGTMGGRPGDRWGGENS